MLDVAEAQARITALESEAAALEKDSKEIGQQVTRANQRRDTAYIAVERNASPQAEREAAQALAETRRLSDLAQRKATASRAVQADLVTARNQLIFATKAAAVVELEAVHSELLALAARLDANLCDFEAWGLLKVLTQKGNSVYLSHGLADQPTTRGLFTDVQIVLIGVMEGFNIKLDKAFNPGVERGVQIRFATVTAAVYLDQIGKQIAYLRRIHIDAHAPVSELVPA